MTNNSINILGVRIDRVTAESAMESIEHFLKQKKKTFVCTPNSEFLMRAQRDNDFKNILNSFSLNLPDGVGPIWAARFLTLRTTKTNLLRQVQILLQWLGTIFLIVLWPKYLKNPIPERICGSDFVWDIARNAEKNNFRIFLLGGAPTVAERAALELQTQINNLQIAGFYSGSSENVDEIVEAVNKSKADILFVALGAPKQEIWIKENLSKTCAKIGIGIGGTLDFIAGERKRAPRWMQKCGLEWLYRLINEPSRLGRQMSIPRLMGKVLVEKLKK